MTDTIKIRTINALLWSFIETLGLQSIRFAIGIVLARMLLPEHFGLIGMLTIFIAFAQSLMDSGFGSALIQKREATQVDTCSIFYFNILIGIVAAGALCILSPWVAVFFNQPILEPLLKTLSLTIVINSFGLIQNTLLNKQINFKSQTKASLNSGIISGIIGVSLAYYGFGIWSLAAQQVFYAFFKTVFLWWVNDWRPALIFSIYSLQNMFCFGSRLLVSGLLNQFFENIYTLVIGKLFSATDLGFFTRANALQELPSQTLANMVGRVTFPVFSTIQNDSVRLKRGMKKALNLLVLVNFPMMIGLAVIARPLIILLMTDKWAESIPYFQLLCLLGLLYPLHVINLNLLQALGKSKLFLRLEVIKKVLIVINIAVTWRWGICAMIYGMIVLSICCYYLNSYYTGVLIGYSIREQIFDLIPSLVLSLIMGAAVFATSLIPFKTQWFLLVSQIGVGIVAYILMCLLFRIKAFMDILSESLIRLSSLRVSTTR